jgi:hypothetical protein
VVFPDHEGCLAEVTAFLDAGDDTEDPVQRVCDAVRLVLRMYTENPAFSVQRYRLTKKVPGLRAYELSVVWRYERAFADYLRRRLADRPDGSLLADVVAAAVAAAHNNALRSWLRSDGTKDVSAEMDHALGFVRAAFDGSRPRPAPDGGDAGAGGAGGRGGPDGGQGGDGGRPGSAGEDDVVVLVSRRGAPLWKVVQRLETALAQDGDAGDRPGGRPGPAK